MGIFGISNPDFLFGSSERLSSIRQLALTGGAPKEASFYTISLSVFRLHYRCHLDLVAADFRPPMFAQRE
jgi:hypothetical protein